MILTNFINMTDFINNKGTSDLVAEKVKEKWVEDSATNNTRIEEVWQKNINGKKEAFEKFNRRISNPGRHCTHWEKCE